MSTFRSILVPVDFSECSVAALRLATELARHDGAELTLLHVYDTGTPMARDVMPRPAVWVRDLEATVQRELDRLKVRFELPMETRTVVLGGSAGLQIVDWARAHHTDLIVMGTHGRTALRHLVLGSVAERVVRLAPCSVLTIRA